MRMPGFLSRMMPGRSLALPPPRNSITPPGGVRPIHDGRPVSALTRRESRGDVYSQKVTGLGGRNSKTGCSNWQMGVRQPDVVLEDLYEFNSMGSRTVDREPRDALANGVRIKGITATQQDDLDAFLNPHQPMPKMIEGRTWARLFGGGALYASVDDGRTPDQPIDFSNIREFIAITPLERRDLRVGEFETDLNRGKYWAPKYYQLTDSGQRIDPSRLIIFQGIPLSRRRMAQRGGWGGSVIDRIWHDLEQYGVVHQYLAEAITRLTQGVLTMPDLDVSLKGANAQRVLDRLEALSHAMSAIGDIALGEGEQYQVIQRGVQGFKDAADLFVSKIVAATDMPRSILLGETPGGLNSGGNEGDWQTWTSHLANVQTSIFTPAVRQLMNIVFASGNSPLADVPQKWDVEWPPLRQLSETDEATVLAQTATAAGQLILNEVIEPHEARSNEAIRDAFGLSDGDEFDVDLSDLAEPESVDLSGMADSDVEIIDADVTGVVAELDTARARRQAAATLQLGRLAAIGAQASGT